jgi:hypothetical protein
MENVKQWCDNSELDQRASIIGAAIAEPVRALIKETAYIRDGFVIDLTTGQAPVVEHVVDRDNFTRSFQKVFIKGIEERLLPMVKDFEGLKKVAVEQMRPGFFDVHVYVEEAHYIFPASYL